MKENKKKFELVQVPKIKHELNQVGKEVEERIASLNLEKQVVTEDTIQSLKKMRAELNKEHSEYKSQLKLVKDAVSYPYIKLQDSFKINITDKYINADNLLKDKITAHETILKDQKKTNLISYFKELVEHEKIDFIKFEDVGLNINLTVTEKKLKEECNDFIGRKIADLELIKSNEFQAEIMVEYKTCLNASKAILTVNKRKADAKIEADRIMLKEQSRRKNAFLDISMVYDSTLKVYRYNDEIYVTEAKVNESNIDEFNLLILSFGAKISEAKKVDELSKIVTDEETKKPVAKTDNPPQPKPIAKPIEAPKVEEVKPDLELLDASFTVTATMPMLQSLVKYLKENNYTYKTIE